MSFARILMSALIVFCFGLVPARAQLAAGSAWQAYKWDYLNLYQGNGTSTLKPEILMLLDDTGSTSRLMYHPLFPQNWQDETPPNSPVYSQDYSILAAFSGTMPTAASPLPTGLYVGFVNGTTYSIPGSFQISASNKTYTIGGKRGLDATSGQPYNTLIKPNGQEVTYADVAAANLSTSTAASLNLSAFSALTSSGATAKNNIINWLMCASHVRLQCTVGTHTRTIDFPLSYMMLDPTSTPTGGTSAAPTGPLQPALAYDPVGLTNYMMDTTAYAIGGVNSTNTPTAVCMNGGYYTGSGYVRSRYIEWVFWGLDPNSPGGAYYCIPNAITSSDATVLNCIQPTVVTYQAGALPAGFTYNGAADAWTVTGYSTGTAYTAFTNQLPNRTRGQAIKECVIKTWLNYQNQVMLALRTFDVNTGQTCTDSINDSTATMTFGNNNWIYMIPSEISTQVPTFAGTIWSNGDSTPLTDSTLNSMVQMQNPAAFAPQITLNGYTQAQLQCQHHFLLILTDGAPTGESPAPNEGTAADYPYYTAAFAGNTIIAGNSAGVASSYFNNPTLAGMAAQGGNGSLSSPTWIRNPLNEGLTGTSMTSLTSGAGWNPFWITQRTVGGTAFTLTNAQAIQTMTVGVSLGVNYYSSGTTLLTNSNAMAPNLNTVQVPLQNDYLSAKFRLLASAYFGDPAQQNYNINDAVPFYLAAGSSTKSTDAAYFFDGRDPATLVSNLGSAFSQIIYMSQATTNAAPVFPTLGAGLGQEIYIGMFVPPPSPGPLWSGDLLMYPTQSSPSGAVLTTSAGNPLVGTLSASNASWSVGAAIANRGWTNRTIYSRVPSATATPNPPMVQVNLGANGQNTANAGYAAIQSILPGASATLQLENWQFLAGANLGGTESSSTALPTRSIFNPANGQSYLMGDIVGSSPTVLQYNTMPASVSSFSPALATAWSAHNPGGGGTDTTGAFRMIFVGENQGLFHAFGEVSWVSSASGAPVTQGVVDEIWAFAPTEILPYIDQLRTSTNKHYYAVDGAPTVYLLDLPQTGSQATGDGMFDIGALNPERAIVVFGLGKGGRSYYAINVADPGNPSMQWALCPNEQYNVPAARLLGGSATVIAKMGLATPSPTMARVVTSKEGTTNQIVDTVLLGGGYSDSVIEAALPAAATTTTISSTPATGTLLGRSVVAVDVWTGNILNTWDTSTVSGAGPVPNSVIPVQITPGTGIISRAYYTDYYGGLWALGGTAMQASPYNQFRTDTPIMDSWNTRQVYTQPVTAGLAGNGLNSTQPVPFLLNSFPMTRTTAPLVSPFAVGVAWVTGDRNNPLDIFTYTPWAAPTQHRMNVLFDRQDINSVISAAGLANAGAGGFDDTVGTAGFYLNANLGYYINFPTTASASTSSNTFVPKGVVPPLVLDGSNFYSYFTPTTSVCNGGNGGTSTYQVCNIIAPVVNAGTAASATAISGCASGLVLAWTGIASNFTSQNILTGVQAGLTSGSGTTNNINATTQNLILQNLNTHSSDQFPKVHVWRVIH